MPAKFVLQQGGRHFDRRCQVDARYGITALAGKALELSDNDAHARTGRTDVRQILLSRHGLATRQERDRVVGKCTDGR